MALVLLLTNSKSKNLNKLLLIQGKHDDEIA
jgi:hypothetical protein